MFAKILSTIAIKLLTERVIINVTVYVAEYLAQKSTNKLDDKIVAEIKEALK